MAGHAQLKFVMTECSKTQIRLTGLIWGKSSNKNINKTNKLQRRACKIILGNECLSLEEACNHLNMLSFEESVFLAKTMYRALIMFVDTQLLLITSEAIYT